MVKERASGQSRLIGMFRPAQAGFQRAPAPVRAAEQISSQRPVTQVPELLTLALKAAGRDYRSGQHPGPAVAAQAYFPDPRLLAWRKAQGLDFFGVGVAVALMHHINMKALKALLLQGPGKRAFHL